MYTYLKKIVNNLKLCIYAEGIGNKNILFFILQYVGISTVSVITSELPV